jgi:hypothetical protein
MYFTELSTCRIFLPLPFPDDLGRSVILMRTGLHNPEKVKATDLFKTNMMIVDVILEEEDRLAVCGTVNVMDSACVTLAHMTQFTPSLVKKMTTLFQVKTNQPT